MGTFDTKVVVITGAGGGLGRSHALRFAKEGAKVVVNDLGGARDGSGKSNSMADEVVEEIRAAGGTAVANYDSVSTRAGAQGIIDTALEAFGRLDILVNNAGILRDKTLLKVTDDMWEPVIAVHLTGSFLVGQAAAKAMVDGGEGGRIINTTSVAGLRGNYGQTNYAAAKAGIYGMTRVWSMELQKHGITANAIAPIAKTRLTDDIAAVPDALEPQMVTPVVLFLASDRAADVNGRIFGVHGRHVFEYEMKMTDGVRRDSDWTVDALAEALPQIEAFEPKGSAAPEPAAAAGGADSLVERVKEVFARMPLGFLPDAAAGWNAVMHFEIESGGDFTVTVKDGACTTAEGVEGSATCVVNTDLETFVGMLDGTVDGQQAFMQGKLKATNIGDMMKYKVAFSREKAQEAARAAPAPVAQAAAEPASSRSTSTSTPTSTSTSTPTPTSASTSPSTTEKIDPVEAMQTLFAIIGAVLPAVEASVGTRTIDFDLGAQVWRLTWSGEGARAETVERATAESRFSGTFETLAGLLRGELDPAKTFDSLAAVSTRMSDFLAFEQALKTADWSTQVAEAIAARPVRVSGELRTKTLHGEPLVVHREHALAYARATNDLNGAYETGVTPPMLAVRYQHELARKWLTDPGAEVDLMRLVYGGQQMRFHLPLQAGDVLSPKVNLESVEHKPTGSILNLRYRLMRDGELATDTRASYFVRGKSRGGTKTPKSDRKRGPTITAPDFEVPMAVRPDQSREYAEISLDNNPLHTDDGIAQAAGFKGVILHGLCTLAFASQALVSEVGGTDPLRLLTVGGRFSKPVFMKDQLTVLGKKIETNHGIADIAFEVVNQNGELVISHGRATVGPRKG